MHQINQEMKQCVEKCLECYKVCREAAMNHCLQTGGEHVEPHHFRLMINCADICATSADFMLSNSELHARICAACAEICEACARSCEDLGDMDNCVRACRVCAESCRRMAGARSGRGKGEQPAARS